MARLNEVEAKVILSIENIKRELMEILDSTVNDLTNVKGSERIWWGAIVDKYRLDKSKTYRIWIDGEIMEERRVSKDGYKVF